MSDISSTVTSFNALSRNPKTPSGLVDNHWHFCICHVPLNPPGDIIFLTNPGSRYTITHEPDLQCRLLRQLPLKERAAVTVALLLQAFIKEQEIAPLGGPWTWSTDNAEFAQAVGEELKNVGVKEELTVVGVSGKEEGDIAREGWSRFVGVLMETLGGFVGR